MKLNCLKYQQSQQENRCWDMCAFKPLNSIVQGHKMGFFVCLAGDFVCLGVFVFLLTEGNYLVILPLKAKLHL